MWWKSVRSIISVLITGTYCYGFAIGMINPEAFAGTMGAIVVFYFMKHRNDGGISQ